MMALLNSKTCCISHLPGMKHIGLDILERFMQDADIDLEHKENIEFLIDVAFECHKPAAAKFVWEKLLSSGQDSSYFEQTVCTHCIRPLVHLG